MGVRWSKRLRQFWHTSIVPRIPERIWLWTVVTRLIFSDSLGPAQYAVRKAATDGSLAGIKHMDAWQRVFDRARVVSNLSENILRNWEAVEWTSHAMGVLDTPMPLYRKQLLVEMAYLALKERGR